MKKNRLIYLLLILAAAIFISENAFSFLTNFTNVNRAGDVVGPGITSVKSCTGCHTGVTAITNNNVSRIFTFDNGKTSYIPGKTHTVKFKIFGGGPVGFSTTVLRNDSNTMYGTLTSTDTSQTKLFLHIASGRSYLNHRVGTTTGGSIEYSFTWTAPAKGAGPVTFYFSSLTSNNDQSSSDDTTYLNTYVITEGTTTGMSAVSKSNSFVAYPNPATDRINVDLNNASACNTIVSLYSIDGKQSMNLLNENLNAGEQKLSFDLSGKVKAGIYFIKVSNAEMNSIQKILIY